MKNLNFKVRIAKINEQRQRLALAKTDEESQISQEASNGPDVLNDGPHASFELRTCSKSFEQECQKCQVDKLQAGIEPALAVLPQPPVLLQPSKATLYYPTLGHDLEGV